MKTRKHKRLLVAPVAIVAAALLGSTVNADTVTIAEFAFTGGSAASTDTEPLTTVSDIAFGSGIDGSAVFSNDRMELDATKTIISSTANNLSGQLGNALNNNMYFTFTVTIPNGVDVGLASLTVPYSWSNAYRYGFGVFTDKTGYVYTNRLDGLYVDTGTSSNTRNIDLSGVSVLQDLTNTTVDFRLYISDGSFVNTRWHYFDNIVLQGTASTSIFPGSMIMLK